MQPENVISALATGDNFDNALFQAREEIFFILF